MRKEISIFMLCFIPRLIFLFPYWNFKLPLPGDWYTDIADSLLRNGTFAFGNQKTTFWEPLYPIFLACSKLFLGENYFFYMMPQLIINAVAAVFFYKLCLELSGEKKSAEVAVVLYSFYPYWIRQSATVIDVTLFSSLLVIAAYTYQKISSTKDSKTAVYCGVAFGFACLMRATSIPIWLLCVTALFYKKQFTEAMIILFLTAMMFLPYGIRNYTVDGSFLPTRSGQNLFYGNCEYTDKLMPSYSLDALSRYRDQLLKTERPDLWLSGNEHQKSQFLSGKASDFIKRNPLRTLKIKILNVVYLFYPRIVPFQPAENSSNIQLQENGDIVVKGPLRSRGIIRELIYTISYSFIFLTALIGMFIRRGEVKRDLVLYFILSGFVVVYAVYWPTTRYRSPMDFILIFFSACAISHFLTRRKLVLD